MTATIDLYLGYANSIDQVVESGVYSVVGPGEVLNRMPSLVSSRVPSSLSGRMFEWVECSTEAACVTDVACVLGRSSSARIEREPRIIREPRDN